MPAATWRDYYEMCKPRVVLLMLLCTLVGMYLATPGWVALDLIGGVLDRRRAGCGVSSSVEPFGRCES